MPITLVHSAPAPRILRDHAVRDRQALLRDVDGATRPDSVAIFLSKVIACLFAALVVLGYYIQARGGLR